MPFHVICTDELLLFSIPGFGFFNFFLVWQHILSTSNLYEMQMCQLSWHWLPYITPPNGHDSRKSSVCAGAKCIFRSQNVKVFVVLSRNHSFHSLLRWILDFQTLLVLFVMHHLHSSQWLCHDPATGSWRLRGSISASWASSRGDFWAFFVSYKMSGSWIVTFHALALIGAAKQVFFFLDVVIINRRCQITGEGVTPQME